MSPTASRLINLLRPHTPFAEAIVRRQAERLGLSYEALDELDLPRIAPMIVTAASMFLDPPALALVKSSLRVR
jgi:hypothetical protein